MLAGAGWDYPKASDFPEPSFQGKIRVKKGTVTVTWQDLNPADFARGHLASIDRDADKNKSENTKSNNGAV
jgi:hypothetical protein